MSLFDREVAIYNELRKMKKMLICCPRALMKILWLASHLLTNRLPIPTTTVRQWLLTQRNFYSICYHFTITTSELSFIFCSKDFLSKWNLPEYSLKTVIQTVKVEKVTWIQELPSPVHIFSLGWAADESHWSLAWTVQRSMHGGNLVRKRDKII